MDIKTLLKYIAGILLSAIGAWVLIYVIYNFQQILTYQEVFGGDTGRTTVLRTTVLLVCYAVLSLAALLWGVFVLTKVRMQRIRLIVILGSVLVSGILLNVFLAQILSIPDRLAELRPTNDSEIGWYRTFEEIGDGYPNADSAQRTADGGCIIALTKQPSKGIRLIKTDENGHILWDRVLSGGQGSWATSLQQTNDGGYVVCGTYVISLPRDNPAAGWHLWITKIDAGGNKTWEKSFDRDSWGGSARQTRDDGYVVCGQKDDHVYLVKLDSGGSLLWEKVFALQYLDKGKSVQQTDDGGYMVYAMSTPIDRQVVRSDKTSRWLIKTDGDGNELWDNLGGIGFNPMELQDQYSDLIERTSDGNYVACGSTKRGSIHLVHLWKYSDSDSGNVIWEKYFKEIGGHLFVPLSVDQTLDGGFIICGRNVKEIVLLKIAPSR